MIKINITKEEFRKMATKAFLSTLESIAELLGAAMSAICIVWVALNIHMWFNPEPAKTLFTFDQCVEARKVVTDEVLKNKKEADD